MKIEKLIVIGIYALRNKITQECYIGESSSIFMRLGMHLTRLKNNKHKNWDLQESWNKYGWESFELELLEECTLEELDKKEMYWITKMGNFNIMLDGFRRVGFTAETKKKMSDIRLENFRTGKLVPYQYRFIYQYDLDGNFLNEYSSLLNAAKATGASSPKIVRAAKNEKSTAGFMWRYYKEDKINPYFRKIRYDKKGLVKLDKLLENPEEDNQQPI